MPFSGRSSFEKCVRQIKEPKVDNLKDANCLIFFFLFLLGQDVGVHKYISLGQIIKILDLTKMKTFPSFPR